MGKGCHRRGQVEMVFQTHGGKRRGAERKPNGQRPGASHAARPEPSPADLAAREGLAAVPPSDLDARGPRPRTRRRGIRGAPVPVAPRRFPGAHRPRRPAQLGCVPDAGGRQRGTAESCEPCSGSASPRATWSRRPRNPRSRTCGRRSTGSRMDRPGAASCPRSPRVALSPWPRSGAAWRWRPGRAPHAGLLAGSAGLLARGEQRSPRRRWRGPGAPSPWSRSVARETCRLRTFLLGGWAPAAGGETAERGQAKPSRRPSGVRRSRAGGRPGRRGTRRSRPARSCSRTGTPASASSGSRGGRRRACSCTGTRARRRS
jgi:hypothetical protein